MMHLKKNSYVKILLTFMLLITNAPFTKATPEDLKTTDKRFCSIDETKSIPNDEPKYFTRELISSKLSTSGLTGWVHGVNEDNFTYIFTYRSEDKDDPMAFFKAEQFTLIPNGEIAYKFANISRHDKVTIWGKLNDIKKPVDHVYVENIEISKTKNPPPRDHQTDDLPDHMDSEVKIHANVSYPESGRALIVDFNGSIVPVLIAEEYEEFTRNLIRGDIVHIKAHGSFNRSVLTHYILGAEEGNSISLVNSILDCHGKEKELSGTLVRFDKSPAISRNVYAIKVSITEKYSLNFTFLPRDFDPEVFEKISMLLERSWEENIGSAESRRNYWENRQIRVNVSGIINMTSKNQANPQVFIDSEKSINLDVSED